MNPNLVVRTYYNDSGRSGYFSTNAGRTWTTFATEPAAAATNGPGLVVISADGSRLVWAIPGSPSFYSTNNGATWTQCAGSNPTPPNLWEQPYPFSDRVNSNKFYIYMPDSGVVYVSTNGGANFYAGATLTAWADSMRTTFGQESNVWVAINNGLWCSTNSAASFFQVSGVQAAHTLGFGQSKTNGGYPAIYLHGEINNTWGVYRSDDRAATWTRINDNQHQYGGIQQVIGDPKIYGRCYIGALGIVYGDLPNQPPFTPTGLTATASNAAVLLTWNTAVAADSYMIGRSTITGGPYTNIATGVTATTYLDTGLINGTTYYYVVAATNSYGSSSNSAEASAAPAPPVPTPWQTQDIGAVGITGGSLYANGVFTLTGAGGDIQGTADAFRFDYVTTTGNCTIIARVSSVQNIDSWSKAGVMIRQSLDAGAANAFVAVTPGNGVTWQYRSSAGGNTSWNQTTGLSAPYWVKLVRSGNIFTGYRSPDGVTWTPQGTNTFTMTSTVYVGLALTSHNSSSLGTAAFDNVTVPGWPTPPAAPTGLTATAGNAQVGLIWSASATATNYYVKRSLTSGSGYIYIGTNATPAFTDTGLVNGTPYYYVVSAVNAYGESTNSTEVSATPLAPPAAPAGLTATAGDGSVALSWSASATATNYYIRRSLTSGSGYTVVATNASLALTDPGLINGTLYYYVVSAVNISGEGAYSTEVSARPTSSAPTQLGFVPAGNQLQLNWPLDHTGWQLQSQTNSLGTNWVNVTSSAQTNVMALPVDTANGAVFFRLMHP